MKRGLSIIVAATKTNGGIGNKGQLPWKLPSEMQYFKRITTETKDEQKQNAIIMGRNTWESIPCKFRPLKGRLNVVLTKNSNFKENICSNENILIASSLEDAIKKLESTNLENIFVIGGGSIYRQVLESGLCNRIYLTEIDHEFECDTFFKMDYSKYKCISTSDKQHENDISYTFCIYEACEQPQSSQKLMSNHEENQYLNLIQKIINEGVHRGDRTGTGTLSIFGAQMRFSLRNNVFPLLTTKRVFWRGVAEELLWFISGDTNAATLQAKNIRIWDGNGSREYLDSLGLKERETGDLGPVYGFQWRHFGAKYINMHTDYTGKGIDQLAEVINKIKNKPNDRRIVLTAWNPMDLSEMALPPCHMFCQFYVANGELSCQMYQRSADMGLGVPFNIASYALLTRLIAQVCQLKPGEFIHTIGDAHVYLNHVEPLKEQLKRTPRTFPHLHINPEKQDIDTFNYDDFTLEGYLPHKTIKMEMSV